MANELSLTITATETKNGVTFTKNFTKTVTVTGNSPIANIQAVGTADETLAAGDAGSGGYIIVKNLDGTNFVELGHTSGTYNVRLKAGEIACFRAGTDLTTIHAKANTAGVLLEYLLLPD